TRCMRKSIVFNSMRALRVSALFLVPAALTTVQGCTDLSETPTSAITPDNFYRNSDEVLGGLAAVYAQLRQTLEGYYNISQVSTDENVVPTRGQDWYDNGRWLELHRQTWQANSPAGLEDIGGVWNDLFGGVSRANQVLEAMEKTTVPDQEIIKAELRTLRALYYFFLTDFFGGIPIVTNTEVKPRAQNTRAEVFKFIEDELNAARLVLPDKWPGTGYGRMTKGAANAILASLYLNAQVMQGTNTAAGLTKGTQRWQDAVTAADRVINSGIYSLNPNWKGNFDATNRNSPENVLVVRFVAQDGLGLTIIMRGSHYSQNPSGWNGFATLPETYNAFDPDDARRSVIRIGQQYDLDTGLPLKDRAGNPLVFTLNIADVTAANENEGPRIEKFPRDPARVAQNQGTDFPHFRLAEMYLIKAEAMNELGQTAAAVDQINLVRARQFTPQKPLVAGAFNQGTLRDQILKERLFELLGESKRRQDLIRAGKYTDAFSYKLVTQAYRILMPIPQSQIETNPLLKQNPGY
ncbi:MAG: RagB/SusD family nutrient uptake outer membrane protein, partial [Gemmatimonadaceae bacterium]